MPSAAMYSFVIEVGAYGQPLTKFAIQTAEKIGPVNVDIGNTSCQVPFAPDSIRKAAENGWPLRVFIIQGSDFWAPRSRPAQSP